MISPQVLPTREVSLLEMMSLSVTDAEGRCLDTLDLRVVQPVAAANGDLHGTSGTLPSVPTGQDAQQAGEHQLGRVKGLGLVTRHPPQLGGGGQEGSVQA